MASLALLVLGLCAWCVLVRPAHCLGLPPDPFAVYPYMGTTRSAILSRGALLQLGGAAGLQHNGAAVASVLNASKGTAITGDLTYTTTSRHFISYEWFKYVNLLASPCKRFFMLSLAQQGSLSVCSTFTCRAPTWLSCVTIVVKSCTDTTVSIACRAVLQAVVLLFALGVIASGQFHRFRIAICCLLAVTTVLFCDACQTFYYCKRF